MGYTLWTDGMMKGFYHFSIGGIHFSHSTGVHESTIAWGLGLKASDEVPGGARPGNLQNQRAEDLAKAANFPDLAKLLGPFYHQFSTFMVDKRNEQIIKSSKSEGCQKNTKIVAMPSKFEKTRPPGSSRWLEKSAAAPAPDPERCAPNGHAPRSRGPPALRHRCEEKEVPLKLLGQLAAADLLREMLGSQNGGN